MTHTRISQSLYDDFVMNTLWWTDRSKIWVEMQTFYLAYCIGNQNVIHLGLDLDISIA